VLQQRCRSLVAARKEGKRRAPAPTTKLQKEVAST
jgi:hypothetical protein